MPATTKSTKLEDPQNLFSGRHEVKKQAQGWTPAKVVAIRGKQDLGSMLRKIDPTTTPQKVALASSQSLVLSVWSNLHLLNLGVSFLVVDPRRNGEFLFGPP